MKHPALCGALMLAAVAYAGTFVAIWYVGRVWERTATSAELARQLAACPPQES